LTGARAVALALGLAGLITILGGGTSFPLPQNTGDILALLAGMVWAMGTLRVRMTPTVGTF
jgi:drug/metabolite transporter (DMT)-like permease